MGSFEIIVSIDLIIKSHLNPLITKLSWPINLSQRNQRPGISIKLIIVLDY